MRVFITVIATFFVLTGFGQSGGTSSKKAEKIYLEAKNDFRFGRMEMAEIRANQAIEKDPEYLDAMMLLAEISLTNQNFEETKKWSRKIIDLDPNYAPNLIVNLAVIEQLSENYEEGLKLYERYMKIAPPESSNYKAAKLGAASCEYAIWAMANPVDFNIENMGEAINSEHDEYFPSMTADEQTLMFTRALPVERASYYANDRNEDFYFAQRLADGTWEMATNPGPPLNTPFNEGAPNLSVDGLYLFYTACDLDQMGNYGGGKKGYGRCDLFVCLREGNKWGKPHNLGQTINTKNWESQPSFASDGKTLYFIRRRQPGGGQVQTDIYFSELKNGTWSVAQPLPYNINTPYNEESVFIHPDNQTLYFSSDGHIGMGGMDIYMSRRQDDGSWGDPVNLGYPINTSGQENSFNVAPSGAYAIIASDRDEGFGGMDLYRFDLPDNARPQSIAYLKGTVLDASNDAPLAADFQLLNVETNDTIAQSISDSKNGEFLVVLPAGEEYALYAQHKGYLFHSENFKLDRDENSTNYEKTIKLQPLKAGGAVVLKNVFFDTDKFELKPKSKVELDKLNALLKENAEMKIEIGGHTDNQGNAAANQTLSANRALAVRDYLVQNGVSSARLTYKSYGQTKPIASNDTEEGRQQNRRTEFRVIEWDISIEYT